MRTLDGIACGRGRKKVVGPGVQRERVRGRGSGVRSVRDSWIEELLLGRFGAGA